MSTSSSLIDLGDPVTATEPGAPSALAGGPAVGARARSDGLLVAVLLAAALLLVVLGWLSSSGRGAEGPAEAPAWQALRYDHAQAVASSSSVFPGDRAASTVALPHRFADDGLGAGGSVWYRLHFDLPAAALKGDELTGVYLERACSNVQVVLNGRLVHRHGRLQEPVSRLCPHPRLVSLPSALLQAQGNTLDIQVIGLPPARAASQLRTGGLSAVVIGPHADLAQWHDRRHAVAITLPEVACAALMVTGALVLLLGWLHRPASHLAWFSVMAMAWGLLTARMWWRDLPLPMHHAEVLLASLVPLVGLGAVLFLLTLAGRPDRRVGWLLAAQCALTPLVLWAAPPDRLFLAASVSDALVAAEITAALACCLWVRRHGARSALWPLVGLAVAGLCAMALELVSQQTGRAPAWSQVLTPLVLVTVGLLLIAHYGMALQQAERGRLSLEQRIHQATLEIERNFGQLAELRVEQVTERERKRIAADLHDDLGAKLLTIIHTSDSERISTLAREALEEMRLSVRGLTGKPMRLIDALGDWRAEVVSRLGQAGIESNWSSPTEDIAHTLPARTYVQTTRILREAVSNIIKHSGASHCALTCQVEADHFLLLIQDNGKGIPMELDGRLDRGHGMSSMKQRAKQMQGQCLVESGPGYGTVIRLTLPL
ncbi:ATP-binding protein [Aquabacterium sp. J223]|uniref:sensor histidine kinase n=1 Tax=Aquabacterium sp. J223 TaxID=2898431 RepID=UPI0021ADAA55|nr:ATP-binding protein [Aquabacterium sp. J223]UUX95992.1 ATP-binding protein [Aquabacterium sp. J223]